VDEKHLLRARLRTARREYVDALPASTRALILLRPPAPVAGRLPEGAAIGLYHATRYEAPTAGYARWLLENGRTLALPWFADRSSPMTFRQWTDPFDMSDLQPGPWGALQPRGNAPEVVPHVVFVPLLGFTADGHRLGQGGGHYDCWLAAHPDTVPIGLAWDMQKVESLPLEPHDRCLEAIVTPTRFFETAKGDQ